MKFLLDHWRDYNNKAAFSMWYVVGFIMMLNQVFLVAGGVQMMGAYTGQGVFDCGNQDRHWTEVILVRESYKHHYLAGKLSHIVTSSILGGLTLIHVFKAYAFCDGDFRSAVQRTGVLMYLFYVVACVSGYAITSGMLTQNLMTVVYDFATAYFPRMFAEESAGTTSTKPLDSSLNESVDKCDQKFKMVTMHATCGVLFMVMGVVHMLYLHTAGNSKFKNTEANKGSVPFWTWAVVKDMMMVTMFWYVIVCTGMCAPNTLGLANTEHGIVPDLMGAEGRVLLPEVKPEWHLMPYFGALKCLTHKISGEIICAVWFLLAFAVCNYRQPYSERNKGRGFWD